MAEACSTTEAADQTRAARRRRKSTLDHFRWQTSLFPTGSTGSRCRLRCSSEIVSVQRVTWEGGFEGLWPCSRNPPEIPDRLSGDPTPDQVKARNRIAAAAYRDQEANRHRRVKVERSLQLAEDVAGRDVWQAWYTDHRGRLYANAAQSARTGLRKATLFRGAAS